MAARRGITLYHSPASRAFTAYWMLEEIGVAFDVKTVDIRKGEQKDPAYLKLNPAGKVPTLTDGDVGVSENPAIAIYLADRYSLGTLAPRIEDAIDQAATLAEEGGTYGEAIGSGGVLVTGSVITVGEARVMLKAKGSM